MGGMLEGVTSKTKALMKMVDCSFRYPTREVNTINNISIQVSMASRVAVIGVNGAGKSTMIKMLIGEITPNEGQGKGDITRHPNMRLAYVAQHAFHHIENHLDLTPVNYLEWRFSGGMDREGQAKISSSSPRTRRSSSASTPARSRSSSRAARASAATSTRRSTSAARTRSRTTRGPPRTRCCA